MVQNRSFWMLLALLMDIQFTLFRALQNALVKHALEYNEHFVINTVCCLQIMYFF